MAPGLTVAMTGVAVEAPVVAVAAGCETFSAARLPAGRARLSTAAALLGGRGATWNGCGQASESPRLRLPGGVRRRASGTRCQATVAAVGAAAPSPVAAKMLAFVKYQGLGNDFILVDNRGSSEPLVTPEQAIALCDRHFGIGGDGIIFALPGENGADYTMRIFNSDGSEPEMCGNGIRCLAKFLSDLEQAPPRKYTVHTLAGTMVPEVTPDGQVTVDMGEPILSGPAIPTTLAATRPDGSVVAAPLEVAGSVWKVTCVSMGNPHCVTFDNDKGTLRVDDIPLDAVGPLFERNAVFPARTNTEFVEILSRQHLKMRVWERGAGATLACGTGACALVVAAVLEGRADRACRVDLPGGPLYIEWREDSNRIFMTGPAEVAFSGTATVRPLA